MSSSATNTNVPATGTKRKVRIFKPHTHEGKRLAPGPEGLEIEVYEQDAKFLDSIGVTTRPSVSTEVPPAATAGGIRPQG